MPNQFCVGNKSKEKTLDCFHLNRNNHIHTCKLLFFHEPRFRLHKRNMLYHDGLSLLASSDITGMYEYFYTT